MYIDDWLKTLCFSTHSHLLFILICEEAKYSPLNPWTTLKNPQKNFNKPKCLNTTKNYLRIFTRVLSSKLYIQKAKEFFIFQEYL